MTTIAKTEPLYRIRNLKVYFPLTKGVIFKKKLGIVKAVDGITIDIPRGQTLGLVGESGSGKSTFGRAIVMLTKVTEGEIEFNGVNLLTLSKRKLRERRKDFQVVFQDPFASLNPRMTVESIIAEPLRVHHAVARCDVRTRVAELMEIVGLNPSYIRRFPHEFSGGQRQRIGLARALALRPKFILADEPISALDVSIQAQIINLLRDLQKQFGLTYLFISHDLSAVRHVSEHIAVMYLGKLVEVANYYTIYSEPLHPYTKALISAIPIPNPKMKSEKHRIILKGDIPNPLNVPTGCAFRTRCQYKTDICRKELPQWKEVSDGHRVACHLYQ